MYFRIILQGVVTTLLTRSVSDFFDTHLSELKEFKALNKELLLIAGIKCVLHSESVFGSGYNYEDMRILIITTVSPIMEI